MSRVHRAWIRLCRAGFPWEPASADDWRRLARQAQFRRWPAPIRPVVWIAMAIIWPVASLRQARRASRGAPPELGPLWLKSWRAAIRESIPPDEFISYRLNRPGAMSPSWRYEWETAALLSDQTDRPSAELLADKKAAARWMAGNGVPTVPVLDSVEGDEIIVKPRRGARGEGIAVWRRDGDFYAPSTTETASKLTPEELTAQADRADAILQPRIKPHTELGHACAVRLVTYRPAGEQSRPAYGLVQTVPEGEVTSHRGPMRSVDIASGMVLAPGPGQLHDGHATPTPCPIEGKSLPGWSGMIKHLLVAHDELTGLVPLVGWDVIFGPDGPLVLEGNTGISLRAIQADRLEPAGIPTVEDLE